MFKKIIDRFKSTVDNIVQAFKPSNDAGPEVPTCRPSSGMPRFWWRADCFTPQARHGLQNNKALMYRENTLLQGLLLRHFKEVA